MPRAGDGIERADAHLRWAGRYTKRGETQKAIAHFGRALEYDTAFGPVALATALPALFPLASAAGAASAASAASAAYAASAVRIGPHPESFTRTSRLVSHKKRRKRIWPSGTY